MNDKLKDLLKTPAIKLNKVDYEKVDNRTFVKSLRKKLNMTQRTFAGAIGASIKTIEKWESGQGNINSIALRLLYLLNKDPQLVNEIYPIEYVESTSMRDSAFTFMGYHLAEIELLRNPNSSIKKVGFEVADFNYSKHEIMSVSLVVNLEYEDNMGGFINYHSAFKINDATLKESFMNYDTAEKSKQHELLGGLIAVLFPYVRQSISSITSDSGFQIVLPILDARQIAAGGAFVYSEHEDETAS
ncbi:MAG: type II toxin-antitoxin system MqsA family antitoxin [Erysipelothrix sp.]|nr:type II toxin-antitoxin system MqsA family antitoxin [Erysipelothrix sp.]